MKTMMLCLKLRFLVHECCVLCPAVFLALCYYSKAFWRDTQETVAQQGKSYWLMSNPFQWWVSINFYLSFQVDASVMITYGIASEDSLQPIVHANNLRKEAEAKIEQRWGRWTTEMTGMKRMYLHGSIVDWNWGNHQAKRCLLALIKIDLKWFATVTRYETSQRW